MIRGSSTAAPGCLPSASGAAEPRCESLQLGLFCCLPCLISFNDLSPSFPPPSQIPACFQVVIPFLSPQRRVPLPGCLQSPSLLPVLPSLSLFVLHWIVPSCRAPGCIPELSPCLVAILAAFLWFSHLLPVSIPFLAVCTLNLPFLFTPQWLHCKAGTQGTS